ncbi:hypothetical protein [Streptomyces sp. NPDC052042]|uniref:hypothetical protein n=1 Tax=Streptomyces sp. NPDC052042 TaxID=3365683 RepID=UPI0037D37286
MNTILNWGAQNVPALVALPLGTLGGILLRKRKNEPNRLVEAVTDWLIAFVPSPANGRRHRTQQAAAEAADRRAALQLAIMKTTEAITAYTMVEPYGCPYCRSTEGPLENDFIEARSALDSLRARLRELGQYEAHPTITEFPHKPDKEDLHRLHEALVGRRKA